jgi:cytochrome b involved in lipid metabolism
MASANGKGVQSLGPPPTVNDVKNSNDDTNKPIDPPPRKKVILGRGFSLMDWIRFTKETPDLAGNQGIMRTITYEELAKHNKEDDCWLAIYGSYR